MLRIETIQVGQLQTNCYLIADDAGMGAVIDPGDDADRIIAIAKEGNINISKILLTHGHWDHIGGVSVLAAKTGAATYIHKDDAGMVSDPFKNLSAYITKEQSLEVENHLVDNQIVDVGDLRLKVIHTPGHTPGGICFLTGNNLFGGDLLFQSSVGRTDLPGGNQTELMKSIQDKIMILPDEIIVYPGHGPTTTVGQERANNPYL